MAWFTRAARWGFWLLLSAITGLSLLPLQFAVQSGLSDKIEHFAGYAALSVACRIGYRRTVTPRVAGGAIIAYGIAIEIAQSFIPGRMMSGLDVVANTVGAFIGLGLAWFILKQLPREPAQ